MAKKDIQVLLDLDGVIIQQAGGFWVKFSARQLPNPTEEMPQGIKYSLTLHSSDGTRVMGFDNAHAVKLTNTGKYKHRGRKTFDHRHRDVWDIGIPYTFVDAHQLLADFWREVDRVLHLFGVELETT